MYKPRPIDTSHVKLPETIVRLTERLAENNHEIWAQQRLAQGWTYGQAGRWAQEAPLPYWDTGGRKGVSLRSFLLPQAR